MALDKTYLEYEHRSHGMDHDLYPWTNMFERDPVKWPGGEDIALWVTVPLEFFPLTPNDGPFRAPGHMVTPYPDYRTFTTKDYGNRIGIFRILKVLKKFGIKPSVPMNAAVAQRYPYLVDQILEAGAEVVAHGVDMNKLHFGGLAEADERAQIEETVSVLRETTGQAVNGWVSPARSQSENTLHLLGDYGITYVGDWVNDDMPYSVKVNTGTLTAMPHTYELEDRHLMVNLGQNDEVYAEQIWDAASLFTKEAKKYGGRVLHLGLTPYVIGQPFRIHALSMVLEKLLDDNSVWSATGTDIAQSWENQQS